MIVVGLTGGIGSGKSTVAGLLAARGASVIDLDVIAHQVAAPGAAAYDALVKHFGPDVVTADGTLDRGAIAARVFSDQAQLAALNAITHPVIAAEAARLLVALAGAPGIVLVDIPLLTEGTRQQYGLAAVIVVDAPVEAAVDRLVTQRGLSESDARARTTAQMSREQRRRLADVVVDNGGSRQELAAAIGPLWDWLQALAARYD